MAMATLLMGNKARAGLKLMVGKAETAAAASARNIRPTEANCPLR